MFDVFLKTLKGFPISMADFERIIKLVIIIMLQSSAIGVLSQSSAIIWLVDTMAEL